MTKDNHAASAKEDRGRALPLTRVVLMLAVLAISFGPRALAQTAPAGAGNAPQPFFYPAPPEGFDPAGASDLALQAYGFPRRPPVASTEYASWADVVTRAKTRIVSPIAQTTNIRHGRPLMANGPQSTGAGNTANISGDSSNSYNWSGLVATGVPGYFMADGSFVKVAFQAPAVGNDNCSYAPYMDFIWGGMDGWSGAGANDVLQAGINVSACPTSYWAWYEWWTESCTINTPQYPCYATSVNLPINVGDYIYIVVTYHTSSPHGNAFISNQSTGQYVAVGFDQPSSSAPNTAYAGSSADWVVERPTVGYNLVDLTNYLGTGGPSGQQYYLVTQYSLNDQYGSTTLPPYGPESTLTTVNMICPPWNPYSACSSGSQNISIANFYYNSQWWGLFTQASGPAVQ